MPTYIILIEVALLFFALGVIVASFIEMGRDEYDPELDFTPFNNRK